MRLYYSKAIRGNFGDEVNEWLWSELQPGAWDETSELWFAGIGSILWPKMPPAEHWVICGSGTGYGRPPIDMHGPDTFVAAVRGPLTARVLGLDADRAVTDGAILLALLPRFAALPEDQRSGVIFVPHHNAIHVGDWQAAAALAGVQLVDPRGDANAVIQAIRRARLVLADSMHAAVVADTLRVPWIPVATSVDINAFKWLDWTLSMGLPYEPFNLSPSTMAEHWRGWRIAAERVPSTVTGNAVDDALEWYARASLRPLPTRAGLWYKASFYGPQRVLKAIPGGFPLQRRLIEAAADKLRQLATAPGTLSDADVFAGRLAEFEDRLQQSVRYAAEFERTH